MALEIHELHAGKRVLGAYERFAGADAIAALREQAAPTAGLRVLHLCAAPLRPAAAATARMLVPLLRDLGVEARWALAAGDAADVAAGTGLRDGMRGGEWALHDDAWAAHRDGWEKALAPLLEDVDVVVAHEPETLPAVRAKRAGGPRWVWRTTLDVSAPDARAIDAVAPLLRGYDARVVALPAFAPPGAAAEAIAPALDPLAPRDIELPHRPSGDLVRAAGVDLRRPFVCQVGELDGWSDPEAALAAWRIAREHVEGLQLVLVGRVPAEEHRSWRVHGELGAIAGDEPGLLTIASVTGAGDVETGAVERLARAALHTGLRPGDAHDVAEAMWKRTPVIGSGASFEALVDHDGEGLYAATAEERAAAIVRLVGDPGLAAELGRRGRERIAQRRLATRLLADEVALLTRLTSSAS